jgi:catechol 2,3-dioxygenase-like lactoylglutathione lyase family enzyme
MAQAPALKFEGVVGYATGDGEEAAHFFEHTLGLQLAADEDGMRFYPLAEGLTAVVDATGRAAGEPPYLLFSTENVVIAAEYFLDRGCVVKELPWATGAGFLARSPEGHAVAVVATDAMA